MNHYRHLFSVILLKLSISAFGCSAADQDTPSAVVDESADRQANAFDGVAQEPDVAACASAGTYHCFARVRVSGGGQIQSFVSSKGLSAADLASAYRLDTTVDPHATIAIVDAYGYPQVERDLATYRSHNGLPPCTRDSGCLTVLNQHGKSRPLPPEPPAGDDWTIETALDLDLASAACPKCKLLLIQADDDRSDGLFRAQQVAVDHGATVISNSWGRPETPDLPTTEFEKYFDHPGVGTFVAAGDAGYNDGGQGPDYPGTSALVVAVGGTSLVRSKSTPRGWAEKAWAMKSGAPGAGGSACSLSIPKPSWQKTTACKHKASADISAVGDPSTGLAVYNGQNGGWLVTGGTSASAPFVAGVFALTGHGDAPPSFAYKNPTKFYDVTSGTNGRCGNVLCKAGPGWDGPTGVGTPNGAALAGTASVVDDAANAWSGTSGKSNACAHPYCVTGAKLTATCDPVVSRVCAADAYCCQTQWDATCVGEVPSLGAAVCD